MSVPTVAPPDDRHEEQVEPTPAEGEPRRARIPLWVLAFAGFLLLGAAWSLAAPYNGGPDERAHIIRAAGVYSGRVLPHPVDAWRGTGTVERVPASLVTGDFHAPADPLVSAPSYVGRYNVAYYLVVGLPLRLWPDWTGLYLARLLTSLMVAALLAAGVAALGRSRYPGVLAAVFVAVTPVTMHLAGVVNPNAVEIAAGFLLVASLIPALLESDGPLPRRVLWQSGVAAAILANVRFLGPVWLLLVLALLVLPGRRVLLGRMWSTPRIRYWLGALALAVTIGVLWTLVFRAYQLAFTVDAGQHLSLGRIARTEVFTRWPTLIDEMVGTLGPRYGMISGVAGLAWYMLAGLFILGATAFGGPVDRIRVLGLLALTFAVPTVAELATANRLGYLGVGRYLLPTMVGVCLLAGQVLARQAATPAQARSLVRLAALVTVPVQVMFLWFSLVYWRRGVPVEPNRTPLNPLGHGHWQPPAGGLTVVVLLFAGAALLIALAWRVSPSGGRRPVTAP